MLDIDEMSTAEIYELLHQVGYCHLGYVHAAIPNSENGPLRCCPT